MLLYFFVVIWEDNFEIPRGIPLEIIVAKTAKILRAIVYMPNSYVVRVRDKKILYIKLRNLVIILKTDNMATDLNNDLIFSPDLSFLISYFYFYFVIHIKHIKSNFYLKI